VRKLAVRTEMHEANVWAACCDAAAKLPGNVLGALTDYTVSPPLVLVAAIDSWAINRVIGLGLCSPATRQTISSVTDFYRSHGQHSFAIELSPAACPPDLAETLEGAGFRPRASTVTKMWGSTEDLPPTPTDVQVRRLGPEHRDAIAELNAMAWGTWLAADLKSWFGATVGTPPFRHYGVFDGDRLVSVGALAVTGALGWLGFAATHPHYRGRGLRRRTECVRIADARDLGCRIVHLEMATEYALPRHPFAKLYQRTLYTPYS